MVKKNKKNEIDIHDSINVLWKNKFKILLITVTTVIIIIFFKASLKTGLILNTSTTEIRPISIFDSKKFAAYNTYLLKSEIKGMDVISNIYISLDETLNKKNPITDTMLIKKTSTESLLDNNYLDKIDSNYLYNLFVKKLNEKNIFKDGIKKFNLIKASDYPDNREYENAVNLLASSIKIINLFEDKENTKNIKRNDETSAAIRFQTYDKDIWKNVLEYVEETTNIEIKDFLKANFDMFILNAKEEKQYLIEDIDFEIGNNSENTKIKLELLKLRNRIVDNRIVKRLKNYFYKTPIIKSNNFKAATLDIELTDFESAKKNKPAKILIIQSIILGALLGVFYVMIVHALQKRST